MVWIKYSSSTVFISHQRHLRIAQVFMSVFLTHCIFSLRARAAWTDGRTDAATAAAETASPAVLRSLQSIAGPITSDADRSYFCSVS